MELELITSPVLTVPHGFPTRAGGVSPSPWASLNASSAGGDEPGRVQENLARLAAAARVSCGSLRTVSQVHGVAVVRAGRADGPLVLPPVAEADAVWTDGPGTAVGVKTADCVPVLIEGRGRVAAVHAGWRGVIGEILPKTLALLGPPASLRVSIGPCIQRCCFEVDGDLPARFTAAFGPRVVHRVEGKQKVHLDSAWALASQLTNAGVTAVDVCALCTHCDTRFFSHRRDRGVTGRHLSFITLPGAAAL